MTDVEIYIEEIEVDEIIKWLSTSIEDLVKIDQEDELLIYSGVYRKTVVPIIFHLNVEDKNMTGVWINSVVNPWGSDVNFARDAFGKFNKIVYCDPGEDFPLPTQFLEVSSQGERVVDIS